MTLVKLNYGYSDFYKAHYLYRLIGAVGVLEGDFDFKPEKTAKHYLSKEFGVSKNEIKKYIIPKKDFAGPNLNTNCCYYITDVSTYKRLVEFVCKKLVQHGCGINNDEAQTEAYYFEAVISDLRRQGFRI